LLANNYKSTPRNKLIADFCKNVGIIEKYGSGVRRIIDYFASWNLPFPEFRNISDGFMVTVFDGIKENDPENDRLKRLILALKKNKYTSRNKLAVLMGVSASTIKRDLEILKEQGIIKRMGPAKGGYWEVAEND